MTDITEKWWGWWRPSKHPTVPVPIGARSVGRANFRSGWKHNTGVIQWVNIYWGLHGEAEFLADGTRCRILADNLLVLPPKTHIVGIPVSQAGIYRWMTIDGPAAWEIVSALNLDSSAPRWAGKCPVGLFDQLENEVLGFMADSEYRASAIAYEILVHAAQVRSKTNPDNSLCKVVIQARKMLEDQYTDPDCNVDRLAKQLEIHRSRLSRLFHKDIGMPPSKYLQQLRLRRALFLLSHKDMSIRQIACACGYSDPAYFSRQVTREMGQCPNKFRKSL